MIIHRFKASENHYPSTFVQFLAVYIENTYLLTVNEVKEVLYRNICSTGRCRRTSNEWHWSGGGLNQAQLKSPLPIVYSALRVVGGKLSFYTGDDPSVHTSLL